MSVTIRGAASNANSYRCPLCIRGMCARMYGSGCDSAVLVLVLALTVAGMSFRRVNNQSMHACVDVCMHALMYVCARINTHKYTTVYCTCTVSAGHAQFTSSACNSACTLLWHTETVCFETYPGITRARTTKCPGSGPPTFVKHHTVALVVVSRSKIRDCDPTRRTLVRDAVRTSSCKLIPGPAGPAARLFLNFLHLPHMFRLEKPQSGGGDQLIGISVWQGNSFSTPIIIVINYINHYQLLYAYYHMLLS